MSAMSESTAAVRPATDADLEGVIPLMLEYCDFYEVAHPDEAALSEMARALIAAPDDQGFLFAASDGDRVCGFAACGWKWSSLRGARVVVMEDLYVHPDYRGRGLADELIRNCADTARTHGAPAMLWETQPDNKRAQAVYNRVGGVSEMLLEYELELSPQD
jgi:ribosomal protein S18 acetylase RimI-like enzyme